MTNDLITLLSADTSSDWMDVDERMFHACFVILGNYVETELGKAGENDDAHRDYRVHAEDDEKAIDLWLWYRDHEMAFEHGYPPEEDCDIKLRELIEIRRTLWT